MIYFIYIIIIKMAKISRCPKVTRHDFPDEMLNYIDEKMEEG